MELMVDGMTLLVIAASMECVLQTCLLSDLNVLDLQTLVWVLFNIPLLNSSIFWSHIAVQNKPKITGDTYIGAANNEANDFPVFCADNYPVDPSRLIGASGNCKECSILLSVPTVNAASMFAYKTAAYSVSGYAALCEDI
jgi:hypothetical protein